jgi:ATF/CREB family transcription factor
MFPAPSPNSQAIFSSLHLGVNTPNTLEFLRTSQGAKAATNGIGPTSQPSENQNNMDLKLPTGTSVASDPYVHPDADAANGLFMLAQSNGARTGSQFAVPQQPTAMTNTNQLNGNGNGRQQPSRGQREPPANPASSGSTSSEEEQPAKPATRSRGKKTQETKAPNNRRKATDTPVKTPASKRQKANAVQDTKMMEPSSPMSDDGEEVTHHKDGRKMTDEEKRKNFLERNR